MRPIAKLMFGIGKPWKERILGTEAVAIPFGANTALYFLRDLGKIRIIGASGAIGSAGVQLGKHFGVTVAGVCSGANVELVKTLGADTVIDYTRTISPRMENLRPDIRCRRRDDV